MKDTFNSIIKDKKILILLILIIAFGIFIRSYKFSEVGYWNDDQTTLPTGLLWFYDHSFYPGLLGQGEPALGNYIFGKSCMLSGEDFSGVTKIQKRFYPGREIYLGKQLVEANGYCHAPMYIFGILFFFAMAALALLILDKYGAVYVISLIAVDPFILIFSRWIHVDIILYFFITIGLIALFKALEAEKGSKKEKIFWGLSIAMIALAFSTKLPAAIYFIFTFAVMSSKYIPEIKSLLQKMLAELDLKIFKDQGASVNINNYIHIIIISVIVIIPILLISFEWNLSNILEVINAYREQGMVYSSLSLNKDIIKPLANLIGNFGFLNAIILGITLISIPFFLIQARKGNLKEKFIAALILMLITLILIYPTVSMLRVLFTFSLGLLLLSGIIVKGAVEKAKKLLGIRTAEWGFALIMILIISVSGYSLIITAPHFMIENKFCSSLNLECDKGSSADMGYKPLGEYLNGILNENETFFPADMLTMLTYYTRYDQELQYYLFREGFKAQVGRTPYVEEFLMYFKPNNQTIRYLLIDLTTQNKEPFVRNILENYEPLHIVYQPSIKQVEVIRVYDLQNLKKKNEVLNNNL